ncbi:MAG TPA: protease pro-enzyme activation domain-containing protein [Jatrophihabitantaceae bacterium]|nr:protease pro-enzyme activation domain-containing protein [Jatrophihabitantaceae bacterium]
MNIVVRAAVVVALVAGTSSITAAAVASPAAQPRVPLPGSGPVGKGAAHRLGSVPGDQKLSFAMTLPLRNAKSLQRFIADASTPGSPGYGHYLTPQQFADRYAPTSAQVDAVTSYLKASGLHVTHVSSNRTVVDVTGPAKKVATAMGTSIGRYHDARLRRTYTANDGSVQLPQAVARQVLGVVGLDQHYPLVHAPVTPAAVPHTGAGPAGGYTPAQLKSAYDVAPLASSGYDGTGQTVGLFELAGFQQANITAYDSQYALGSPAPSVVPVDGGTSTLGNAQVEVELDIEVVQAIAPKANIKVWEGPNNDQGVIDIYNAMAQSNSTPVNSTSWGLCEPDSTSSTISSEDQIFSQMAAQGQSVFAASGDSAAYDCGTSGQLAVDNPADDPYVTGAGGTNLTVNSNNTWAGEVPWDTNATEGGGGGVSTVFAKPSWQTPTPGACTKRCVPDISADADPATGYSIYTQGGWTVVGGTSAAAPIWAGMATVYNHFAVAAGHARLGYANPSLYQLAAGSQTYPAYHDVTTGHTSTTTNWPAVSGYDLATGIGSVDAYNFSRDLVGAIVAPNNFSISASPASVTVAPGAAASVTVSTATTNGSAQTVSLTASGLPSGASASFAPASVTSGSSSTLTLSTAASTPAGTYSVTVTGTGTSATHSVTVGLTVSAGTGSTGNLVGNPGFESGTAAPWTLSSGVLNNSESEPAHTGSWDAWLDGYGSNHTDSATQSITVPAGMTSATVSFYLHIDTAETTTTTAYDRLTVRFGSTTLATYSNLNHATGYTLRSFTLNGVAPGTYVLSFSGSEDVSLQTSFVLDDVSVIATGSVSGGVTNGGFETGTLSGWTPAGAANAVITTLVHSGSYAEQSGSTAPTNGDSSVTQTFTVPSGRTSLSFWYDNVCPDTITYDWATATLRDNTTGVTSTVLAKTCVNPSSGWRQVTKAVTALHSYTLTLTSHDDNYAGDPTYTNYDDVTLS